MSSDQGTSPLVKVFPRIEYRLRGHVFEACSVLAYDRDTARQAVSWRNVGYSRAANTKSRRSNELVSSRRNWKARSSIGRYSSERTFGRE
jgi:hypothetical protein